jgi:hypothetical protein
MCQPIADWLAQSFVRAAGLGAVAMAEDIQMPHMIPQSHWKKDGSSIR